MWDLSKGVLSLNTDVWVRPTEAGIEIIRKSLKERRIPFDVIKTDRTRGQDDWWMFTAWELFRYFGPAYADGPARDVLFEGNEIHLVPPPGWLP